MDDESFDPKQWISAGAVRHGTDPNKASDGSAFWRAATQEASEPAHRAVKSVPPSAASSPPDRRMLLACCASVALLCATAATAWLTRSPPRTTVSVPVTDASDPAGAQERAVNLSGPDELGPALLNAGICADDAAAAAAAATPHLGGDGEIHMIIVIAPGEGGLLLQQLRATRIDGSGVVLSRASDGTFAVTPLIADLTRKIEILRGEIDSESFYTSAVSAGLVDTLIPEFINAFGYDFNLAADVAPGDVFEVAYDQDVNGRGDPVGQPKLLFALLTTPKKSLALYRFQSPGAEAGWFDGNGAQTKRGLMRTPVDGARITSKFGMRFHPVLHYNKLHRGTDFAALTGTPIYAAADGTIEWAAMKGANGNLTILRHDNGWETYYLHQSAFAAGVTAGARVNQGQHIGDVGTTGRSTGPHLHYEVHIDGEPVDPQGIITDDSARKRLDGAELQAFLKERDRIDAARSQRTP